MPGLEGKQKKKKRKKSKSNAEEHDYFQNVIRLLGDTLTGTAKWITNLLYYVIVVVVISFMNQRTGFHV